MNIGGEEIPVLRRTDHIMSFDYNGVTFDNIVIREIQTVHGMRLMSKPKIIKENNESSRS
jgi:hypothetical protein